MITPDEAAAIDALGVTTRHEFARARARILRWEPAIPPAPERRDSLPGARAPHRRIEISA
jgi:hypothetical protein